MNGVARSLSILKRRVATECNQPTELHNPQQRARIPCTRLYSSILSKYKTSIYSTSASVISIGMYFCITFVIVLTYRFPFPLPRLVVARWESHTKNKKHHNVQCKFRRLVIGCIRTKLSERRLTLSAFSDLAILFSCNAVLCLQNSVELYNWLG